MVLALLGMRLLLAVVFAVAGASKLRDRPKFARAMTTMGAPAGLATAGATLIPLLEMVIAASLLATSSARLGGFASMALLGLFSVVVAINLTKGRRTDCACFGAASAEPIGGMTLVRNAVLFLIACVVAVRGPGGDFSSAVIAWQRESTDDRILALTFSGLAAVFLITATYASRLLGNNHRLTARLSAIERSARPVPAHDIGAGGLAVGALAPPFELARMEGDRASLTSLHASGRPIVLLFLSAHCPACHELWPDIERWQRSEAITVAAVCSGSAGAFEMKLMGFTIVNVLLEEKIEVGDAYALALRPAAVIVADGRIASRSVAGVGAIRALVERWVGGEHGA